MEHNGIFSSISRKKTFKKQVAIDDSVSKTMAYQESFQTVVNIGLNLKWALATGPHLWRTNRDYNTSEPVSWDGLQSSRDHGALVIMLSTAQATFRPNHRFLGMLRVLELT